ncbi:MAG: hypothetical protein AAFQ94_19410 [Bacteroidota bacterium]
MKYKYLIGALFLIMAVMIFLRTCSDTTTKTIDPIAKKAALASGIDNIEVQIIEVADLTEEPYVVGDGGLFIYVRENALLDTEGNPVTKQVRFELKEVQAMDEFVKGRISTLSNGELLSTAGSYFINATSDGKQLTINPEVGLNVAFPDTSSDAEIELFRGEVTDSGDINWVATNKPTKRIPKPDIKKPKNETDYKGKYDLQQVKSLLEEIDKSYEKVGDEYQRKDDPERGMKWAAGFVNDMREWYKYNQYKFAVYAKQEKKYLEAYNRYLNNPKIKEWMKFKKEQAKKLSETKTAYEYELDQFGWWNCDKFLRNTIFSDYSGMLVYEDGDPVQIARVHLVSKQERIHMSQVVNEGRFSFRFPDGRPFQIYATSLEEEVSKEFDGSSEDLGTLVISLAE